MLPASAVLLVDVPSYVFRSYMLVLLLRHGREPWPGTRWSVRRHTKFELNSLLLRAVKIAEFAIKFPTKAIIYNVCFIGMNIKVYGMKV